MFHANTERMIEHWRTLKGDADAPARRAVDPAAFAPLLPQVFILGRVEAGRYVIRLAGQLIDDLHGGGLTGGDPLALWSEPYRPSLKLALEAVRREPEPLVVTAEGRARAGPVINLEIMLAPLVGAGGDIDRLLGLYQPQPPLTAPPGQPIETLILRSIATARPSDAAPRLRLAALNGRRIA